MNITPTHTRTHTTETEAEAETAAATSSKVERHTKEIQTEYCLNNMAFFKIK